MSEVQVAREPESVEQAAPTPWALESLPPFSPVALRLVELLSRDDISANEVGKFISAEPVFSARVLQIANSPLFALSRQVASIARAVVVVGFERVKGIVLTRALGDFIGPAAKKEAMKLCWRASLAGALIAENLARPCRLDGGTAYTAGLLRDIGRLALLVKYPESYANLLAVSQEHSYDLIATEQDLFELDHCSAGRWIADRLHFPQELCEVISLHHDPPKDVPFGMVHLVAASDRLADALGFSVLPQAPQPDVASALEMIPENLRARIDFEPEEFKASLEAKIQDWR
jgi:HD-like signal output (HDOD) protein